MAFEPGLRVRNGVFGGPNMFVVKSDDDDTTVEWVDGQPPAMTVPQKHTFPTSLLIEAPDYDAQRNPVSVFKDQAADR